MGKIVSREITSLILEMVKDGDIDKDTLIRELLNYMSESEVKDFSLWSDLGIKDDDSGHDTI